MEYGRWGLKCCNDQSKIRALGDYKYFVISIVSLVGFVLLFLISLPKWGDWEGEDVCNNADFPEVDVWWVLFHLVS